MGKLWLSFNLVGRSSFISVVEDAALGLGGGGEVEMRLLGGGSPRYLVDGFLRSDIFTMMLDAVNDSFTLKVARYNSRAQSWNELFLAAFIGTD